MITRRFVLQGIGGLASLAVLPVWATRRPPSGEFAARMRQLEARHGGTIGVAVFDTDRRLTIAHRGHKRVLLCSTVKLPLAALILSEVDAGHESLDRIIHYTHDDLVTYSPETEQHVATGMTLGAICRAGLTQSDNTAANLMFAAVGGPMRLTAFIRSLGDTTTRSDRLETTLNDPTTDHKDTTTPIAMRELIRKILLGDVLRASSRDQLLRWMRANQTGDHRLRAGLPPTWRIGDKTGSGGHNSAADIAIAYPASGQPILITSYYSGSTATLAERDRILADVGRAIAVFHADHPA